MRDIEEHIRRAMEAGEFDNLPGQGKPIDLDDNPLADPEWRTAYHMLKSNGFTLPWIETRREIDAGIQAARAVLGRAWEWRRSALKARRPAGFVESEWERAVEAFQSQVQALNRQVFAYNLQAPADRFHMLPFDPGREIEKIISA